MDGVVNIPSISNNIVKFDTLVGEGLDNTEVSENDNEEIVYILSPNPYNYENHVEEHDTKKEDTPALVALGPAVEEIKSVSASQESLSTSFDNLYSGVMEQTSTPESTIEETYSIDSDNAESLSTIFHSLHSDVAGATDFISNLIEQRRNISASESVINEERARFEKEKSDFMKYMTEKKEEIQLLQAQSQEYINIQKNRLKTDEEEFKVNMETRKLELNLAEESVKLANQRLASDQEHLQIAERLAEDIKANEMNSLRASREKFESDVDQFNKEKAMFLEKMAIEKDTIEKQRELFEKNKEIEFERMRNEQSELSSKKAQFEEYKTLEEKKILFEKASLAKSAEKFKALVAKFNSGFQQLPENK